MKKITLKHFKVFWPKMLPLQHACGLSVMHFFNKILSDQISWQMYGIGCCRLHKISKIWLTLYPQNYVILIVGYLKISAKHLFFKWVLMIALENFLAKNYFCYLIFLCKWLLFGFKIMLKAILKIMWNVFM